MELKGKVINFLGDSITEGNGVTSAEYCYDTIIKEKYGLKANNNYGIGGTRIAYKSKPSEFAFFDLYFCGRAYFMDRNADAVVVFGGTNDFSTGDAPFGEYTDKTAETFCGAVDLLMNTLKELYPNAKIAFITPARRAGDEPTSGATPLKAYVDLIISKGNDYGIPVLNMYEKLGINPNNLEECKKYTTDGLHFNNAGHVVLAERIGEFLESI